MDKKKESDSSSSEDEICMEAIKEAADHGLTNLLLQSEGKKNNIVKPAHAPDEDNVNNDQFSTHRLTQSCRDFIAKKLFEKMNEDIVLEDSEVSSKSRQNNSQKSSGIKLFNSSNTILTEVIDNVDEPKKNNRKKVSKAFDEKANLSRCKKVAIDPQTVLSQHDLKFWVDRKPGKEFKYKKTKNGKLLQIEC